MARGTGYGATAFALVLATTAACVGDDRPPGAGVVPEWAHLCRVGMTAQGLFSGQASPLTVSLDGPARLSLVGVHPNLGDDEGALCTGTLIEDGWVLTAAHCVPDPQAGVSLRFGPDLRSPLLRVEATRALIHPELDVALLQLSTTRWAQLVGAQPIPLWSEPIPSTWIGTQIELAGRGLTRDGEVGELLFVPEPVTALHVDTVEVDGMGKSGACVGDSGGPILVGDQHGSVHVAGTLTTGAASCMGRDLYVRADRIWDWVMGSMAEHPVAEDDPCES